MIPEEVENRIARYYFHNYLPTKIGEELESLLLHYYLMDEELLIHDPYWVKYKEEPLFYISLLIDYDISADYTLPNMIATKNYFLEEFMITEET